MPFVKRPKRNPDIPDQILGAGQPKDRAERLTKLTKVSSDWKWSGTGKLDLFVGIAADLTASDGRPQPFRGGIAAGMAKRAELPPPAGVFCRKTRPWSEEIQLKALILLHK